MVNSRIDKYRDLRSGLKEEVGINRDNMSDVIDAVVDTDDEDDFLMSEIGRASCRERVSLQV